MTTTKIDLDELERKARAGEVHEPRVALALIARIRECEALAANALYHSDLSPSETAGGWEILRKGAMIELP